MKELSLIFEDIETFEERAKNIQFDNRNVIIIENELSRIDSRYFQNALSVKRVLCPIIYTEEINTKLAEFVKNLATDYLIVISLSEKSLFVAKNLNSFGFQTIVIKSTNIEIKNIEEIEQITQKIIQAKETEELEENKYFSELIKIIIP
ncbi:MAG: GT-D fold domain-containing protein [Candidatus Gastranaerophilales bacterium]|nr:GT-D fold domain-containing protein [Candidatus Gastranaerophilales bacterium]